MREGWPHHKQNSDTGHACPSSAPVCPSPRRHAPSHECEGPVWKKKKRRRKWGLGGRQTKWHNTLMHEWDEWCHKHMHTYTQTHTAQVHRNANSPKWWCLACTHCCIRPCCTPVCAPASCLPLAPPPSPPSSGPLIAMPTRKASRAWRHNKNTKALLAS